MNNKNLITMQEEIDELRTKRFEMLEEIDELKRRLRAVNDLNTKILDNQSTTEDFTLPHITKRWTPEDLGYSCDEIIKQLDADTRVTKGYDPHPIVEDFTFPHPVKGRGSHIETLPSRQALDIGEDIRYFREKLEKSMSMGIPTEKTEKQLAGLENTQTTNAAIRNGGWKETEMGTFAATSNEPKSFVESVYHDTNQKTAFERAMKGIE